MGSDAVHSYRGRTVIVTGGAGFIGSVLVRRLREMGVETFVVDPRLGESEEANGDGMAISMGDVSRYERWLRRADVIFNLAGATGHQASMEGPVSDLESNQRQHLLFLDGLRRLGASARCVFTSTRQVYGRAQRLPVQESDGLNPLDINAIHKLAAERYHGLWARRYGTRVAIVRLSNVYGEGVERHAGVSLMGEWFRRLREGLPLVVFGDGLSLRDFLFVGDAVEGLIRLGMVAGESADLTFNFGGPEVWSVRSAASLLCRVAGRGEVLDSGMPDSWADIDPGSLHLDCSRMASVLGWRARTGLEEGVRLTLSGMGLTGRGAP